MIEKYSLEVPENGWRVNIPDTITNTQYGEAGVIIVRPGLQVGPEFLKDVVGNRTEEMSIRQYFRSPIESVFIAESHRPVDKNVVNERRNDIKKLGNQLLYLVNDPDQLLKLRKGDPLEPF